MKVLQLIPHYRPAFQYGGPIYSVHNLAKGLVGQGVDVEVWTTNLGIKGRDDVPLGKKVLIDGVNVYYFPIIGNFHYAFSPFMLKFLKKNILKFDIVHMQGIYQFHSLIGGYYCREYSIPYAISPRGMLTPSGIYRKSTVKKKIYIYMIERRNIANAKFVHCASEKESEDLLELGLKPQKIEVIQNSIELSDWKGYTSCKYFQSKYNLKNNPTVVFLGRLSTIKGLDILICAFKQVLSSFPECNLLLIGPDYKGYKIKIEQLIKKNRMENSVIIAGLLQGKEKFCALKESDIFILPSYSEGFGMSVVEAMLSGLPVIISKEVGIWNVIKDNQCGIVVDLNAEDIAEGIIDLLRNHKRRIKMGENGRKTAMRKFSIEGVAKEMIKAYETIIK